MVFKWIQEDFGIKKRKREEEDGEDEEDSVNICRNYEKFTRIDLEEKLIEKKGGNGNGIKCSFTPYCSSLPLFYTLEDYEEHYDRFHTKVCSECSRVLPTAHLLDLHLCECHDSYFAVLCQRKASYSCFVDDCQTLSMNPTERIQHLRSIHRYPKKFNFDIILGQGKKSSKSKNKGKRVSAKSQDAQGDACMDDNDDTKHGPPKSKSVMNTDEKDADAMCIDNLSSKMKNLMLPRSVKFGGRGGLKKHGGSSFEKIKSMHDEMAPK